ncbi:epsin-2-like isoform X2 [Physella acuta]|uniref:epsin-2-like isoform X2 n=1 Tax=Physella acuta TaxID=109671 RepID=UPI0027DB2B4B|nr:epsin-2-like isoform X2 [Physella acuta]
MPAIRRTLKNVVKNYSDAQVKVREATSNDPWGPSSTLMSEIADLTYNVVAFTEIMQMVWKRLNDDGKNWRHVYKSLLVLDYIIKTGSEKVAQQCKENFHVIKTLTNFQYSDADQKDHGQSVREKAKLLVAMLSDEEKFKNERAKALKAKERMAQNAMGMGNGTSSRTRVRLGGSPTTGAGYQESYGYPDSSPGSGSAGTPSEIESARPSSAGEEELQLQLALAMSKEEHEEHVRKQKSDDIKLQMAIEQSREQAKNDRRRQQQELATSPQSTTLLDLAGPSTAGAHSLNTDPWGMPVQSSVSADPWAAPLPGPSNTVPPDPWGASGGVRAPAGNVAAPVDPWGVTSSSPQPRAGAWSSASPTPLASAHQSTADPFGIVARSGVSNGTSAPNNIDNEFDLLSARSADTSPAKSAVLDEFDLLGVSHTNGSNADAFDMDSLNQDLPQNKKKSAEAFLGGHANLVNLDQLVSKAPPKGNNPFAMTTGASNPFQDPTTGVRMPMAQMAPSGPGFTQPVNTGLLPAPLLPLGSTQAMQTQQGYNPFL